MGPLFLAGHTSIDFLNTAFEPDAERVELIGDGKALVTWLQAANLIDPEQALRLQRKLGVAGLNAAAAEVRRFREWARGWLLRWRAVPSRDYAAELAQLNKLLDKRATRVEVVRGAEGLELAVRFDVDSSDTLIGLLATKLAELLTQEDPAMLKSCAGAGCTLWFLDRTKARHRQYCSAATCGNRAKVAAFRERQRE